MPLVPLLPEPLPEPVPAAPVAPWGMVKFSTAAVAVPTFTTDALDPAAPVLTEPTWTEADAPAGPVGPALPVEPVAPVAPAAPAAPAADNRLQALGELPGALPELLAWVEM